VATSVNVARAMPMLVGSCGLSPKSIEETRRVTPIASGTPIATPKRINVTDSINNIRSIVRG
jgi:hypothetical protein